MKKLLLTLMLFLTGCGSKSDKFSVIDATTAYNKMQSEKVIILDVRTLDEFDSGHIPNAINIELSTLKNVVETKIPDKNETILVYCRSGNRSNQAAHILADMGYTNIYDFGGITSWPYEVE